MSNTSDWQPSEKQIPVSAALHQYECRQFDHHKPIFGLGTDEGGAMTGQEALDEYLYLLSGYADMRGPTGGSLGLSAELKERQAALKEALTDAFNELFNATQTTSHKAFEKCTEGILSGLRAGETEAVSPSGTTP